MCVCVCVCVHVSFSASCFAFRVFMVNDETGLSWFSCFSNGFLSISSFLGFLTLFFFVSVCVCFCICLCILCVSCVAYACMYFSLCMYNFIPLSLCISVYVCVHVSFWGVFLVDCDLHTFFL